jgi:hypothetical protein
LNDLIIPWSGGWKMLMQFGGKIQLSHSLGNLSIWDEQRIGQRKVKK